MDMDEHQVRLQILSGFYKSAKNQTEAPLTMKHEALKDISQTEYNFGCYYLIENGLLHGDSRTVTRGIVIASPSRISGTGIKIVERLIEQSVEVVNTNRIGIINQSLSFVEKLTEIGIIWSKNTEFLQQVWELFSILIKGLQ